MEAIPPGYRLIKGRLRLMKDRVENDRAIPADERTAKVVKQLANNICGFIKMEVDYPSRHHSGLMPILDLQVQIAEDKSVDFKFYQKPMAPPTTILNKSPMPARVKWNSNVQQGIRRLRNTRPRLHAETRNQLMEEWAEMMMVCGYTENHRKEAIRYAVVEYERMVEKDAKGQTPLYRSRLWNKEERRKKKLMKKVAWYRPQDTVIFVPTTPNGELAMKVRKVVQEEGRRIIVKVRVVETAGTSLRQKLVRTDLAANKPCRQQDCLLCITGKGNSTTSHHRSGALYKGSCKLCEKNDLRLEYHGETGYSVCTRTQ